MKTTILVSLLFFLGCSTPRKEPDFNISPILVKYKPARPIYPQETFDAKADGTVVVEVMIDKEGFVLLANARSGPSALFKLAEANAFKWVFFPKLVYTESKLVYTEPEIPRFYIIIKFAPPK